MTFAELYPSRRSPLETTVEDFEFRLASRDDAPELAKLFETFFEEAHYQDRGIVYSPSRGEAWLANVIERGVVPHLVASREGRIVGVCAYELDGTFSEKPVAVLHTIYVLPEYRPVNDDRLPHPSAIGRVLAALVTDLARNDGACAFHVPIASGMEEQKTLINLFAKIGFERIGVILGRRL